MTPAAVRDWHPSRVSQELRQRAHAPPRGCPAGPPVAGDRQRRGCPPVG